MGAYFSTFTSESKPQNDSPTNCNNVNNVPVPKTEIEILLSEELSKLNSNASDDPALFEEIESVQFEEIDHFNVDLHKLQASLEGLKYHETFGACDTYQMVRAKTPRFVISKRKIDETVNHHYFGSPSYYDVYGHHGLNDEIKIILISYISSDISDIILQYCGDGELLFSAKMYSSGYMTLSTTTLVIGDALTIDCTYSEKSGKHDSIKMNDKYDKRFHMYLVWIANELSQYEQGIFRSWLFNFHAFMRYEMSGQQRPQRRSICVVGECLVSMDSGLKRARDIRAGDRVQTSDGKLVRVVCTVTQRIGDMMRICRIGNCYVTPEHPIRKVGTAEWKIPLKEFGCTDMYVDVVNNFVLESEHHVVVDHVECITLAHMFEDPVVKHKIWGTQVVCNFLQCFPSYPDVVIDGTMQVEYLLQQGN
eukprot:48799_1